MTRILQAALAAAAVLLAAPALACEGPKPHPPKAASASSCPVVRAHAAAVAASTCPYLRGRVRPVTPPAWRVEGLRILTAAAPSATGPVAVALR